MSLIYIIIVILIIAAVISITVRRVKNRDPQKPPVEVKILTQLYGESVIPDLAGSIEKSVGEQNMLSEVIASVQDIFAEICADKATCTDVQTDAETGSFALTYQIRGTDEPLIFACRHFGEFDLYFKGNNPSPAAGKYDTPPVPSEELPNGQPSSDQHLNRQLPNSQLKYDHAMDKENIRQALRLILENRGSDI